MCQALGHVSAKPEVGVIMELVESWGKSKRASWRRVVADHRALVPSRDHFSGSTSCSF